MLQAVASEAHEIPDTEQEERICKEKIVFELDSIAQKQNRFSTFKYILQRTAGNHNLPEQAVERALNAMIEEGLLKKSKERHRVSGEMRDINVLIPDWDKLEKADLFPID